MPGPSFIRDDATGAVAIINVSPKSFTILDISNWTFSRLQDSSISRSIPLIKGLSFNKVYNKS